MISARLNAQEKPVRMSVERDPDYIRVERSNQSIRKICARLVSGDNQTQCEVRDCDKNVFVARADECRVNISEYADYDGAYSVTPTVGGETLPTKEKVMREDLEVRPIPFYETSNNSGGTTVYIAKELEVM